MDPETLREAANRPCMGERTGLLNRAANELERLQTALSIIAAGSQTGNPVAFARAVLNREEE